MRTRTTILHAHTYQWLGTFGNAGNGDDRGELRQAAAIGSYLKAHQFSPACAILRLDGQYGTGAVLADLAGLAYVIRAQDDHLLDRDAVQTRLHLPPDQQMTHEGRAGSPVPSMTVRPFPWVQAASRAGSSSPPMRPPRRRVGSAASAKGASTSCS